MRRKQPYQYRKQFGHLYVIDAPSVGMIKIGRSTGETVQTRFAAIQACSPVALVLAYTFEIIDGDVRRIERHTHTLLHAKRKHGEWFCATVSEAIEAIRIAYENRLA